MKGLMLSCLLAGAAVIAVTPVLSTVYADAYPTDPLKHAALERCVESSSGFNRLLAAERAACYARLIPTPAAIQQAKAPPAQVAAVNFVDMMHSAARGRQPQNDVRVEQENFSFTHQRHAAHP